MMILTNSFHSTQIKTRYTRQQLDGIENKAVCTPETLTGAEKALIRRIQSALCGIEGCTCGNFWGERA